MIHLDTHVVLWLRRDEAHKIPTRARALMEADPQVMVSPMVELELAVLYEIRRTPYTPAEHLDALRRAHGVTIDASTFFVAAAVAATPAYSFTRDPFDRLIAAHAGGLGIPLVTSDATLRANLDFCVWD